jgi:hypothetical protein
MKLPVMVVAGASSVIAPGQEGKAGNSSLQVSILAYKLHFFCGMIRG